MENRHDNPTDETLVRAAREGDPAAFDQLLRRHLRPLLGFARFRTRTVQDAEDIVQETFLRAFQNLAACRPEASFKSWLFTIAWHLMVSAARRKRPRPLSEQAADALPAASAPAGPNDWLWDMVGQLDAADSAVLWLRYQQGMTVGEIARVIKKTKNVVRVRLHRARGRLARKLAACAGTEESIPEHFRAKICMERID